MKGLRLGIRGKLLTFSSLAIVLVVLLELVAQSASSGSSREFERQIDRYHRIHHMRVSLDEYRALADRYLREVDQSLLPGLRTGSDSLAALAAALEGGGEATTAALFELRATRRGVEAYLPLVETAVEKRGAGGSDYYGYFAQAERIADFTDGYLAKLLSAAMENGEERGRAMSARAASIQRLSLAGVLAAGFLCLLFSVLFASSISAPIRRLARAAGVMAGGKLEVEPVLSHSGDEVEVLADSFNSMSMNIRRLVEGLKEKADLEKLLHEEELSLVSMGRALREAQLMNLQDQMRPHFLFNALNVIARQAQAEGAPVSQGLARGLGRLLRYSIASEGAFAPLDEEIGIVSEYLSFQKIRFGERLAWRVDVDPGAARLLVPRFTLQPVVENAVRHGIEPKVEGGAVLVSARRARGMVRIRICDSGVGMEAPMARTLRSVLDGGLSAQPSASLSSGSGGAGIGLANLKSRLAFRYGPQASIGVSTRPGRGTIVRISIPEKEA